MNLLTSPSEPLHENLVHVLEPTQIYHSLATETEYVRGKLVDHANDLLSLGTDGFRLDAAKRRSPTFGPVASKPTDDTFSDIPVDDIQTILGRLSRAPSYVTQEVRALSGITLR